MRLKKHVPGTPHVYCESCALERTAGEREFLNLAKYVCDRGQGDGLCGKQVCHKHVVEARQMHWCTSCATAAQITATPRTPAPKQLSLLSEL